MNAGRGFHSNDARGAIDKFDASGMAVAAAPLLVTSVGKEVGVRTEAVPGLQSALALWSLDSDSEILYAADVGTTEPAAASRRYGVEWNNHWTPNDWLLVDADLAWTHARFAQTNANGVTGDRIPNSVSQVALIRAALHDLGPWSGGIETRYISRYPLSQDGSLNAPSALVTNLRLQRQVSPALALSVDMLNVFNRAYFDIAYAQDYRISPTAPIVPAGITVHPGEPRQLRLTLHFRL